MNNDDDRPTRQECERDEAISRDPHFIPDPDRLEQLRRMDPFNPENQR